MCSLSREVGSESRFGGAARSYRTSVGEILGRDGERAVLASAVLGASTGRPRFVLVDGAPGVGKSTLLADAARTARCADARVLRAGGIPGETDFPFGVVRQAYELLLGNATVAERRAWLRGAARTVPEILDLAAGAGPVPAGHAASHALFWLTVNVARQAPLVLVIDDLQWVDPPSLRWLAHLARRLDGLPIAVLAAVCGGEPAAEPGLLDGANVRRLRLGGLGARAVIELITARLSTRPAGEFVAGCLAETGGNPYLLGALLRSMAAGNLPPSAQVAADLPALASRELGDAIAARIARSGTDLASLATAVAVLSGTDPGGTDPGGPDPGAAGLGGAGLGGAGLGGAGLGGAGLGGAAAMAGLSPEDARAAADALARMGILTVRERLSFRYELVRRALLVRPHRSERGQLHLRAARALFDLSAPATEVGARLLETTGPVGEPWVAASLRVAARSAVARGRPEAARAYLRRLLAEPDAADALAELGAVECALDLPASIAHLRSALAGAREPARYCWIAHRLAAALQDAGMPAEAMAVLRDAATRAGTGDPELAAHRLSISTWVDVDTPDQLVPRTPAGDGLRAFRSSLRPDTLPGTSKAAIAALDGLGGLGGLDGDPAGYQVAGVIRLAGAALLHAGEPDALIRGTQRFADQPGWVRVLRACAQNALGRHDEAVVTANAALAALESIGAGPAAALAAAVIADSYAEIGCPAEGLALLDRYPPEPQADWWIRTRALYARGRLRLAAGRGPDALADLLEAGRQVQARGVTNPGALAWRLPAALAHATLGAPAAARRLIAEQVASARTAGLAGVLAEALVAEAVLSRRRSALDEAMGLLGGRPAGQALRARGSGLLAQQLERLGDAVPPADPVRASRPAGSGVGALTAHESRLVALAIAGRTNDEIAGQFGVTRRAVEFHFTRIYRKLGISRRGQLYRFADALVA
jgi:DNA-binding CsgD family transcriptional regulator